MIGSQNITNKILKNRNIVFFYITKLRSLDLKYRSWSFLMIYSGVNLFLSSFSLACFGFDACFSYTYLQNTVYGTVPAAPTPVDMIEIPYMCK